MYDVVALGEMLIDFTPSGVAPQGNAIFEQNPGGAPANVLIALSRLGGKGCFVGKVGDDQFGHYLAGVLANNDVSAEGLAFTGKANTTLAFVHLGCGGERSFSFYRKPGADQLMTSGEVNRQLILQSKFFHFGAVCMTSYPTRRTCLWAAKYARNHGIPISFDPN